MSDCEWNDYAVCIPYYGGYDARHYRSIKGLISLGFPKENLLELHGCPYIDVARAVLVQQALNEGRKGVFFIDHDIVFKPQDVAEVIRRAENLNGVVGVPYSMRTAGKTIVGGFAPHITEAVCYEGGGVYPAAYLGMGFTAIPRAVFEDVGENLPDLNAGGFFEGGLLKPWFALDTSQGWYSGEDISFCKRVVNDSRHGLFLYTVPRIFHRGAYEYAIEDAGMIVPRLTTLNLNLKMTQEELDRTRLNEIAEADRI